MYLSNKSDFISLFLTPLSEFKSAWGIASITRNGEPVAQSIIHNLEEKQNKAWINTRMMDIIQNRSEYGFFLNEEIILETLIFSNIDKI